MRRSIIPPDPFCPDFQDASIRRRNRDGRHGDGRMAEMTPEAFPTLTAGQIARIAPFARERDLADNESLWEAGDRN